MTVTLQFLLTVTLHYHITFPSLFVHCTTSLHDTCSKNLPGPIFADFKTVAMVYSDCKMLRSMSKIHEASSTWKPCQVATVVMILLRWLQVELQQTLCVLHVGWAQNLTWCPMWYKQLATDYWWELILDAENGGQWWLPSAAATATAAAALHVITSNQCEVH